MEPGSVVVVSCQGPREKLWGLLLRLDAVGVVVRGLDIGSVEDWLAQEAEGGERPIAPSTVFVPTHRIERIYLDEPTASAPSYGERYARTTGRDLREVLAPGPRTGR